MPDEILALIIIILGIGFILSIVRSVQKHELKKLEYTSKDQVTGDSLTTSELQQMIEEAVVQATAPIGEDMELLAARIDKLEGSASGRVLLEEGDEVQEKTVGRPVPQKER